MSGSKSKDKGKDGEREVRLLWAAIGYQNARRGSQFRDGSDNADVIGVPYWVEVKRYKRIYPSTLASGYRQGVKAMTIACEREYIPDLLDVIVMARGDRGKWQVLAPMQLLIDMGCPIELTRFKHKRITDKEILTVVTWEQFACLQARINKAN